MNISYGPLTNRLLVVFIWGCVYESFIRIQPILILSRFLER